MMRELIVDAFAGGGGASLGIEMAVGRSPDIAINHDPDAIAMHAANHPDTRHMMSDVWSVDPEAVCEGRPVGLLWASPDCKHFSKAKGGKPVAKKIRDLAWVVIRWAEAVRPRVICLENVEEFRTWGPLVERSPGVFLPCPDRKGQTFERWVGELRRLGYVVEWRELRACDYGAPTIRKRLFLIARCDGRPIVWPEQSHGDPKSAEVKAGRRLPWRTAAEIIDWSLPCPSIFLTREEGRAIGVNRPLAEATMARIAKGVKRYVVDAAEPFIVPLTHQGGDRSTAMDKPLPTVTGAHRGEQALVSPLVSYAQQGGGCRAPGEPLHTVTASPKDQNQIVVPTLVQTGYGERHGQAPRVPGLEKPLGTCVAGGAKHALVAPHLTKFNTGSVGVAMDEPVPTVTANSFINRPGGAAPIGVVAAHISRQFGASIGSDADEPLGTVTAGGGGKAALVSAFLAQHNAGPRPGAPAHSACEPVSTVTQAGSQQAVIEASLLSHQYGSGPGEGDVREPMRTVTADGNHAAEVRAFMLKYYGNEEEGHSMEGPLGTVTTKDRFGLVTVHGEVYRIVDIGMRMLSPRELFRAQGFPDSYIIDRGADGKPTTKTSQVARCGNSVSPVMARALVAANYVPDEMPRGRSRRKPTTGEWNAGPLFVSAGVVAEAAE